LANTSKNTNEINYIPPTNNNDYNQNKYTNNLDEEKSNKSNKTKLDPTIYYSININDIYSSLNNSKKMFLDFEKRINIKLYNNENKLIQIKNTIEENNESIIKYYNNILDDTIKSEYTRTDNERSIDNNFYAATNLENTSKSRSEINYGPFPKKDYNYNYNNNDNFNNNNYNDNKYVYINENKKEIEIDPTIYYSININEIYNSLNNSKTKFLEFEKKINIKLYNNENKLIKIKKSIEENKENIIKYHNNILNETIKSEYTKTDNNKSIDDNNYLLKTSEFNSEGKEYFRVYLKALNLYNNQKYNEAFSLIIEDEIYLLRLLFLAKSKLDYICGFLNKDLSQKIMLKINHICHSHFLMKIQKTIKNAIIKKI
jgi:hypothetical protein